MDEARLSESNLSPSRLDYKTNPFADLYLMLRKDMARSTLPAEWEPALASLRGCLDSLRGDRFAVMAIDTLVGLCDGHGDLEQLLAEIDREDTLRPVIAGVLDAMRVACAPYEPVKAGRLALCKQARDWFTRTLASCEGECLSFILDGLGLRDASYQVPVYLVCEAPRPGAFTGRSRGVAAACFVGVEDLGGVGSTALIETVLHESIHALEAVGDSESSVLAQLRSALELRGVGPRDERQQLWHAVFFVHAAEAVRRFVDPSHADYGDTYGYYDRVPSVGPAVKKHWGEHLSGAISARMAIERMVRDVI